MKELPRLEHSASLRIEPMRAWASTTRGTPRHSGIAGSMCDTPGQPRCFVAEMFWFPDTAPASAMHIVRDFPLDIGVPDRSHRAGTFDSDFSNFGLYMARRVGGLYVLYAYFSGIDISCNRWVPRGVSAGARVDHRGARRPDLSPRSTGGEGRFAGNSKKEGTEILAICDGVGCSQEIHPRGIGASILQAPPAPSGERSRESHNAHMDGSASPNASPEKSPDLNRCAERWDRPHSQLEGHVCANGPHQGESVCPILERGGTQDPGVIPGSMVPAGDANREDPDATHQQEEGPCASGLLGNLFQTPNTQDSQSIAPYLPPTPSQGPAELLREISKSPSEFFADLCGKVLSASRDMEWRRGGIDSSIFTWKENDYIKSRPGDFGLYIEENSNFIPPKSARPKRGAYRLLMEFLRNAGRSPVSLQTVRGEYTEHWSEIESHIEVLIEDSDVIYDEGEGSITYISDTMGFFLGITGLRSRTTLLLVAIPSVLEPRLSGPGTTIGVRRETRGGWGRRLRISQL